MTNLLLVAIGGIHASNAVELLQAGADGLAVVSTICSADDPAAAAQRFRQLMAAVATHSGVNG
jgi:thiamine-phosphate pyrophosphorylase